MRISNILFWLYILVLFSAAMYVWFEPPFEVFKCQYYGKNWEFIVNENGVDIGCVSG